MSSNHNDSINLVNYEEWLLLYTDGELQPAQMDAVDAFLQLHPQLLPELDALLATKLPSDEAILFDKAALLSPAMKANVIHEDLLLYVDNELPAEQKQAVATRLAKDSDYAHQHQLLVQTKADASERIAYPNKAELYRHTERVVMFRPWMRVAAAALALLLGSTYFIVNKNQTVTPIDTAATTEGQSKPADVTAEDQRKNVTVESQKAVVEQQVQQQSIATIVQPQTKQVKELKQDGAIKSLKIQAADDNDVALQNQPVSERQVQLIAIENERSVVAVALKPVNKIITPASVTKQSNQPYNNTETTQDVALTSDGFETNKKTPARGFFRKVSRFIERRTGIGTVNADNELVIGAVALKLK